MGKPDRFDQPSLAPFVIRALAEGDRRRRVVVEGELDLASSPSLTTAIESEFSQVDEVLLDLSGVCFIDSAGLQAILIAVKSRGSDHKVLQISSSLHAQARRLFEITGVLHQLPLVDAG